MSYLGVFIWVLSAYDVYEEKNAVLFTSPIILLRPPLENNSIDFVSSSQLHLSLHPEEPDYTQTYHF